MKPRKITIEKTSFEDLKKEVDEKLKEGYVLLGNMSTIYDTTRTSLSQGSASSYRQVLILQGNV